MNTQMTARKLLTIVCEADLERLLIGLLGNIGARGYTITDARGHGAHGERDGLWPPSANIRIEVICDEALACKIASDLQERYYEGYGMIVFIVDAQVLRPDKF
ncbi:MAG: transcriptional regulator [Proteobacteria bacterium]|nr:transcriptional regulator [Pseudomonadota bacterium]